MSKNIINLAIADCNKIILANRHLIGDGFEPQLSSVHFNGKDPYETFSFPPSKPGRTTGFCKTARRPYDVVVVACLAAIKDRLKARVAVQSDGGYSDLTFGTDVASGVLGRVVPVPVGAEM